MTTIGAVYAYIDSKPPRDRFDYYLLDSCERALLRAMCGSTKTGKGETAWLSLGEYADRAGMSRKTAQRRVQGWTDHRTGKKHVGLKARGILTELAPANWVNKTGAIYRVNWDAFQVAPKWVGRIERRLQRNLPGVVRPAVAGDDVEPVSELPQNPGHGVQEPRSRCLVTPVTVSTKEVPEIVKEKPGVGDRTHEELFGIIVQTGDLFSGYTLEDCIEDCIELSESASQKQTSRAYAEDLIRAQGWSGKPLTNAVADAIDYCRARGCAMDSQIANAMIQAFEEKKRRSRYELLPITFFQQGMYKEMLALGRGESP